VQPGRERPTLVEARQRREGPLERVLRDVVGHRAAAGDAVGGAPGGRPVPGEERRGSVPRPVPGARDELRVAAFVHPHAL